MDRILTVVTPAASKDLTTAVRFKLELGITGSAGDVLIGDYVATASRAAANYCNGELISEGVSEQFRAYSIIDSASLTNLPEYIWLRRLPIEAVSSVNEDGDALVEGTDFELDYPRGRLVRLRNDIPVRWYFRKLIVAYTGGYTYPGTLEPDIEQAVLEIMKDIWFARQRDPLLRSDQVAGIGAQQYWEGGAAGTSSWPPKVVGLLGPFQRALF